VRIRGRYNSRYGGIAWRVCRRDHRFDPSWRSIRTLSSSNYAIWIEEYRKAGGDVWPDSPVSTPARTSTGSSSTPTSPVRPSTVASAVTPSRSTTTTTVTPPRTPLVQACPAIAGEVLSVEFLSDHRADDNSKLLLGSTGDYGNFPARPSPPATRYTKPEWTKSGASYPISQSKATTVRVKVRVSLTARRAARVSVRIAGNCPWKQFLSFESDARTLALSSDAVECELELAGKAALPNYVMRLSDMQIAWTATADGQSVALGTSGPHEILVTFGKPSGTVRWVRDQTFATNDGATQDVTYERLSLAVTATAKSGADNEKQCVDALLAWLAKKKVFYCPGRNWPNSTGVDPKPSLEKYFWMAIAKEAKAECHNLAAAFILVCRILGVTGEFEVGYMVPWPRRRDSAPYTELTRHVMATHGATVLPAAGAFTSADENHDYYRKVGRQSYRLIFIDGNDKQNAFEGVARYGNALYAIGEGRYDLFDNLHDNSTLFYLEHEIRGGRITALADPKAGRFQLCFCLKTTTGRGTVYEYVRLPYGNVVTPANPDKGTFYWHD
jgi:hypothetical protein